tara:strand:- start:754 stop:1206 length:453 start_codon:yes stop_codon:yes gene_type:complete
MNDVDAAKMILESLLGKLGFEVQIEREDTPDGPGLNILSGDSKYLIGNNGDRLEDLQYLTNRILIRHYPDAPRVRVDCDRYRLSHEEDLIATVREIAMQVLEDGKQRKIKPLNAYYRRLAHNCLAEVKGVATSSPPGSGRYKRIEVTKAS